MRNNEATIRGYKIAGERKPVRELAYDYLMLSPAASHALNELRHATNKAVDANRLGKGKPVPCVSDPEWFSGDELPSDRDAQMACAPCPVRLQCDLYRRLSHNPWGVLAGVVHGRKLEEALKEGDTV